MRCRLFAVEPMKRGFKSLFKDHNPTFVIEVTRFDEGQWKIKREYNDFLVLYEHLLAKHPDSIVPCIPTIPKSKNLDDVRFLDKLGKMMTQFLEKCF